MSTELKYHPEDIEFILLNKEYHDLDLEQKSFIEEFVESEEEYLLMRGTMLNIAESVHPEVDIVPAYSIKDALMEEFEKGDKLAAGWWSNVKTMLFPAGQTFVRKPGVQMAFVACSVVLVAILIPWGGLSNQNNEFAENIQVDELDMVVANEKFILVPLDSSVEQPVEREIGDLLEVKEQGPSGVTANGSVSTFSLRSEVLADNENDSYNGLLNDLAKDQIGNNKEVISRLAAGKLVAAYDSTSAAPGIDGAATGYAFYDSNIEAEETISKNSATVAPVKIDLLEVASLKKGRTKGPKMKSSDKFKSGSSVEPAADPYIGNVSNSIDLPKLSRSLDEDNELIELLYTAM